MAELSKAPVLVCGGAGYVGSHACLALAEAGFRPIVYDNLSNGYAGFVQWGPLEVGDVLDAARLGSVIADHKPVAIMHFAGLIEVGQSVKEPSRFYVNNVGGAATLIDVAMRAGIRAMVFSSTCATYGDPIRLPIDEEHPQLPLNPYGRSKLMVEQMLADCSALGDFRSVALRYFNAAGADEEGRIGERHHPETHAIPLAIQTALGQREGFKLFGDDFDTRDGTAVRDYVHVMDLADAHVRALTYLLGGGETRAINLGTGVGTTVRELLAEIEAVTSRSIPFAVTARRPGDAQALVADNRQARDVLGWEPRRSLTDIVRTAWAWHTAEQERPEALRNAGASDALIAP